MSSTASTFSILAILFSMFAPQVAYAQSAIVLVDNDRPDVFNDCRAGAIEALAQEGIRLMPTPDGPPCQNETCAAELATMAGAELAILITVDETVATVVVINPGEEILRDAMEHAPSRLATVRSLVQRLVQVRRSARRGFLLVQTTPTAQVILIDGREAGMSPLRRTLRAGVHQVLANFGPAGVQEQSVEVRPEREVSLLLMPTGTQTVNRTNTPDARADGRTRNEPSPYNWILSTSLAVAGIFSLVPPIVTAVNEGTCHEFIDEQCVQVVRFGAANGVLMGLGLALLGGSIAVDVLSPLRVDVAIGTASAMLRISSTF